jgi:hypothetical protein
VKKNETALHLGTIRVAGRLLWQGNFLRKIMKLSNPKTGVLLESFSGNHPRLGR